MAQYPIIFHFNKHFNSTKSKRIHTCDKFTLTLCGRVYYSHFFPCRSGRPHIRVGQTFFFHFSNAMLQKTCLWSTWVLWNKTKNRNWKPSCAKHLERYWLKRDQILKQNLGCLDPLQLLFIIFSENRNLFYLRSRRVSSFFSVQLFDWFFV